MKEYVKEENTMTMTEKSGYYRGKVIHLVPWHHDSNSILNHSVYKGEKKTRKVACHRDRMGRGKAEELMDGSGNG